MTDKLNEHAGKTLVLRYQTVHEWRVLIDSGISGVSNAAYRAIDATGISRGIPGLIPESIKFEIEE